MYPIGENIYHEKTNAVSFIYEYIENSKTYVGKTTLIDKGIVLSNQWNHKGECLRQNMSWRGFDLSELNVKINLIPEGYQLLWLNVYKQKSKFTPWHAGGLYSTESRANNVAQPHRHDCVPILVKKP